MSDNIGNVDEKQKKRVTMVNHQDFIYGACECEGGYRIYAKAISISHQCRFTSLGLHNTGEWQDCQALFGNVSTRSLWITYSTKEKALAVAVQVGVTVTKLVLP